MSKEVEAQLKQARIDKGKITEEVKRLEKILDEGNIPGEVYVGQVYETLGSIQMVASLDSGNVGLTSVGIWSGCYASSVLTGVLTYDALRKLLIQKKAKYLGEFNEIFTMKENIDV